MAIEQYRAVLFNYWRLIILCTLLAGAGVALGSLFVPPTYQSTVTVQLVIPSSDTAAQNNASQTLQTEVNLVTSDSILAQVVARYPGLTAAQLKSEMAAGVVSSSQRLQITVADHDAARAAHLANDLAAALIAQQAQTNSTSHLQVVEAAQPSSKPLHSTLWHIAFTLAGVGLGLLLGVTFVLLHDRLDQRLRQKWTFFGIGVSLALGVGLLLGLVSSITLVALAAGGLVLGYLFVWDQRALLAVCIVCAGLLVDFFLLVPLPFNYQALATVMALLFLAACFWGRSAARPWTRVPHLVWWIGVIILALPAAIRGGVLVDGGKYEVQIFLNALLLYMVGIQVTRDLSQVRRLFSVLAGFGTLIAIHGILQARTGHVLLPTHFWDGYLASVNNFALSGSQSIRAGSFFINPDSDGTFLALMLFLPVSLLVEAPSRLLKGLYAVEAVLILLGLFFTYSLISIGAVCLGGILFIMLVGMGRSRFYALGIIGVLVLGIFVVFPSLVRLLFSHGSNAAQELSLRLGSWETALRVILANPLLGLGFGFHAYLDGAEPYRVPLQYRPLVHPHNSFLEFAALAGIPVLVVMIILFAKSFWSAFQNYRAGGRSQRILLGGGITALVVITINSLASDSWTLPPLVLVGWLLFGAMVSPGLMQPRADNAKRLSEKDQSTDEVTMLPGGVQV